MREHTLYEDKTMSTTTRNETAGFRTTLAGVIFGLAGILPSPSAQALPCQNCEPGPTPDVPTYPTTPPPMLAVQFDECIFHNTSLFSLAIDKTHITNMLAGPVNVAFQQLRTALGVRNRYTDELARKDRPPFYPAELWPNVDVRISECVSQKDANPANSDMGYGTNIAIWFKKPGFYGSADTAEKRDAWTAKMSVRKYGDQIGIHIDDSALRTFVSLATRYAHHEANRQTKNTPLENKIKLGKVSLAYDDVAKRITTRIDGRVDGIVAEYTDFWAIMRDTLSIRNRYVGSGSAPWFGDYVSEAGCIGTAKVDYGGSIDMLIAKAVLAAADPIVTALNNGRRISINDVLLKGSKQLQGPGCLLAKAFVARQFLVPGTALKLVFDFPGLTVRNGVTVSGRYAFANRNLFATINGLQGPGIIHVEPDVQPQGQFTAGGNDLGPYRTYQWEAPGGIIEKPNNVSTRIRWAINVASGQQVSRPVKVTIKDSDGNVATKQVPVLIRSKDNIPDPDCVKYVCD